MLYHVGNNNATIMVAVTFYGLTELFSFLCNNCISSWLHLMGGLHLDPTAVFPHIRVLVHLVAGETLVGTCLVPLRPPGAETHIRGGEKTDWRGPKGLKADKMETIENWWEDTFGFLVLK